MAVTTMLPELVLRSPEADWDRARWETLPDDGNRYEVIDGVLNITTAPSNFHQWIIRQIVRVLFRDIDDAGVGITTWAPIGLFMPGCDLVQPDILVVRNADLDIFQEGRIYGIPALLIEVLSPSNPNQDTRVKRSAYARAGVPEYWIVRPADRDALVCSQPDAALGDYAQVQHVTPTLSLSLRRCRFARSSPGFSPMHRIPHYKPALVW